MRPDPVPPRYATPRNPAAATYGGKVAKLARSFGMPLMSWQQQVADTALEVDASGVYRYSTVLVTVPRQAGKTSLLRPVMAHRAMTIPKGHVWITAQLRQDAADTWADTADLLQESPLKQLLKRRNTNGSECLTWANKSKIRLFNAGSNRALHGKQSDLVFIDEAFAFTAEQGAVILQAVVPTQATRPGAQTWIVSTAGTAMSTWLRAFVLKGRAGDARRMAYFEWGIPEDTEDLTDLDLYVKHHPAIGHTIGRTALEIAYETMTTSGGVGEFARAYGNFWTSSAEWIIPPALWAKASSRESINRDRPVSFAVEVNADRSGGCIVSCGYDSAGRALLEIVDERPGIGWITERLMEVIKPIRYPTIVIDPVSPAGTVHRELTERKKKRERIPLAEFSTGELVDGHTEFLDDLALGHLTQPGDKRLDASVAATTARTLRETIVFSRLMAADGTSPALAVASVLAHFGHRHPLEAEPPSIAVLPAY
jgi:hypothetical protein